MLVEVFWVVAGLVTSVLGGCWVVPKVNRFATRKIHLAAPSPRLAHKWAELAAEDEGGEVVGLLERLLFFVALLHSDPSTPLFAAGVFGGWLTFKLGTKWQARSHLLVMPENLGDADPVDYLIARRRWASHIFVTFLVGTLTNALLAVAGVLIVHAGANI